MRAARVVDLRSAPGDELSGADVVVLQAAAGGDWGDPIRIQAPNAVVVVVGGSPQPLCEATLFPRARIIGVDDDAAADAVLAAVVDDREVELDITVRCEGERGIDSEFARVPARIGARGVTEIVES